MVDVKISKPNATLRWQRKVIYVNGSVGHYYLLLSTHSMSVVGAYRLLATTKCVKRRTCTLRGLASTSASADFITTALSPRWLSDLKQRIGKCIIYGLQPSQADEAGRILKVVAKDWRELVAGSEGFLVGKGRAGLERHKVVWGEQDVMVISKNCAPQGELIDSTPC